MCKSFGRAVKFRIKKFNIYPKLTASSWTKTEDIVFRINLWQMRLSKTQNLLLIYF